MSKFKYLALLVAALSALLVNSEDVRAPCFFDDSDCGGCEVCSVFICTSLLCEKAQCFGSLWYTGCGVCEEHMCKDSPNSSTCNSAGVCYPAQCGGESACDGLQPSQECAAYSYCQLDCICKYEPCNDPSFYDTDGDGFKDVDCGGTDCDDTVAACTTDCASKKYQDSDGDGHGNSSVSARGCDAPAGYVSSNDDCNDNNAAIHPGASDANCNGVDEDCDGVADDGFVGVACGTGVCASATKCEGGIEFCSTIGTDCGTCCVCSVSANPKPTYAPAQGVDCSDTVCPADGCGKGGCGVNVWADYPVSVGNECSGLFTCTSNSCSAVCGPDADADGYSPSCGDCNDANANVYPGSCHSSAIVPWSDVCDESTAGGCGSGACTRDTGEGVTNCGGSSLNCVAGSNKGCSGGNVWADTDYDPSCIRYCFGGSCEPSCDPGSCDRALWEACSDSCSGQTSASYFAADTVVDSELCAGGSCPSTSLNDVCAGSVLTEYYCNSNGPGGDAVSSTVDCNTYDHQCTGVCGAGIDSCVSHDYGCAGGGSGYCADSVVDADVSSDWCDDCAAQGTVWSSGGEVAAFGEYAAGVGAGPACCGDDSGEKYRSTPKGASTYSACCNSATDCVDSGNACVPDGTQSGGFKCVGGSWVDGDSAEAQCTLAGGYWNVGGEVVLTPCCGDDSGENPWYRKCAVGACVDNAADRKCCDAPTDCVFNGNCYSDVSQAMLLVESPSADCKGLKTEAACKGGVAKKECQWNAVLGKCVVSRAGVQAYGSGNLSAYADVDSDATAEVCVAGSPGEWRETSSTIAGTVRNVTHPQVGALVRVLGTSLSTTTAADGTYTIGSVPSKTHDLVAAKSGYEASSVFGVFVPDDATVMVNFVLVRALGDCGDDCVKVGSNLCDAGCHGKGLCWFDSDATKQACDGTFGLTELPGGLYVDCCMGRAYTPLKADVSVPSKNVVVTKRPVLYKGKFVNMVIILFQKTG